MTCRAGSARYHSAISLAPCSNGITARQPGTMLRSLALSNTIECALSPSSPAPQSGSAAAIASDGTCTRRGVTPRAAASDPAIWFQLSTSSEVMWMASPSVRGCPSSGTNARAKSSWWVSVHSEVPSPCTMTGLPAHIRPSTVHPPSNGTDVAS